MGMPPHNPALGGATAGMAGPPHPQQRPLLMQQAQQVAKMVGAVVMAIRQLPGVDPAKVQQGAQLLHQGMQTILDALPKQAGPVPAPAAPGGAPVPPGGAPPAPPMR